MAKQRSQMPTMQDIADRVGVARATVSNVINSRLAAKRSDAAGRAAEIRRVAIEMGYRPSAAARATRTGRTGFIGIIRSSPMACSVHNPVFDSGLDAACHARGLCLVRDIIDEPLRTGEKGAELPRIVREKAVDGLLINYAFGLPVAIRNVLDRCRIPAIWINRKREHNCVHPDDLGAAVDATRYLIKNGHTRIAYLQNPQYPDYDQLEEIHYSETDRRDGYQNAMSQAGLKPRVIELPPYPSGGESGHLLRVHIQMLQQPDRPSAILCQDGGATLAHAAAILGLRIPDDLSIMTFENEQTASHHVGIDQMLVPYPAMASAAIAEVCDLLDSPNKPRKPVILPFIFKQTGSVARPHE